MANSSFSRKNRDSLWLTAHRIVILPVALCITLLAVFLWPQPAAFAQAGPSLPAHGNTTRAVSTS
jgi:hypothetical protein